jgi:hypothetical protein
MVVTVVASSFHYSLTVWGGAANSEKSQQMLRGLDRKSENQSTHAHVEKKTIVFLAEKNRTPLSCVCVCVCMYY